MSFLDILLHHVPPEWIQSLQVEEDEFGSRGAVLRHPSQPGILFDFVITKERMGVAKLKDREADIQLDLGGFDFLFELEETERFASVLDQFVRTGDFRR